MSEQERYEILLMKAVDGLLSPDEERELQRLLDASPERSAEYHDMVQVKHITDSVVQRVLADATLEHPTATPHTLNLGASLIILALTIASTYTLTHLLTDPQTPTVLRIAIALAAAGSILLLARLIISRLRNPDPYQEIDQ